MSGTQTNEPPPAMAGRVFSAQLHRIRDLHIEMESILQSLAALQDDIPCARCTHVCCKEPLCRESIDSDFLRFVLGARVDDYSVRDGWHVAGVGCRLSHGRPLVCYEYFCEQFDTQAVRTLRQLSRAFKTVYARVLAGQHILVVDDISRISAHKQRLIHDRLAALRDQANAALRLALGEHLLHQPAAARQPGID